MLLYSQFVGAPGTVNIQYFVWKLWSAIYRFSSIHFHSQYMPHHNTHHIWPTTSFTTSFTTHAPPQHSPHLAHRIIHHTCPTTTFTIPASPQHSPQHSPHLPHHNIYHIIHHACPIISYLSLLNIAKFTTAFYAPISLCIWKARPFNRIGKEFTNIYKVEFSKLFLELLWHDIRSRL